MPSTHLSLHIHVVFSTKNRRPYISEDCRDRLHAFLGGAVRTAGCVPQCIGGTSDHVHLLIGIRATHRLADVMRDIKQSSSRWVHETLGIRDFGWQDGYGAFSVAPSQREAVKTYIKNQVKHHLKRTFQEEYVEFLERSGVEYDEKYLW
jgi:REP element-mobilizing transposase RayT